MLKKIFSYSLLVSIILAMGGYCWYDLKAQVTKNRDNVEIVKEQKVDNKMLQKALDQQEKINQLRFEQQEKRQEKVDKHLENLYKELLKK